MIGVWTNQNPIQAGLFTQADQQVNAREIYGYFQAQGWTLYAVSGLLGNMQAESYINPGQWQLGHTIEDPRPVNDTGFGLVQWTPWQKYVNSSPYFGDWEAGANWRYNYPRQLDRIQYELDYDEQHPDGGQWIRHSYQGYYYSFKQYSRLTQYLPEQMASLFFVSYERGTWSNERGTYARNWYDYLNEVGPLPPPVPVTGHVPIWLLFKLKERWS